MSKEPTEADLDVMRQMMDRIDCLQRELEAARAAHARERDKATRLATALTKIIDVYDNAQDRGLIDVQLHDELGGAILDAAKAVWAHHRIQHREAQP